MELNRLKIDQEKALNGVWVKYDNEVEFLIAKKPNSNYDEEMAQLLEPYMVEVSSGTLDDALDKLITAKAVAKTVLLGWKGITVDGEPYEYSVENAVTILSDPDFHDVYRFILMIAHSKERYRIQQLEDASKN